MTTRTLHPSSWLCLLVGCLAVLLPNATRAQNLAQASQQWLTAPAQDSALFQDLIEMSEAGAVLERLVGLPEDEQFAYAVSLMAFLPASEHAELINTVAQRIDASENASAKVRMSLFAAERMSGSPVEALGHIDTAVQLAAANEDLEAMTYALSQRSYLLVATGDARAAATSFGMVAELCGRREQPSLQIGAQLMQANQLVQLGELSKAGETVRAAKTTARELDRPDLLGSVRLTEGQLAVARQDYDEALRHQAAARGHFEKLPPPGDPRGRMGVYQQSGSTYRAMGNHEAAVNSWERMMFHATQLGQVEMVAHALRGMATAYVSLDQVDPALTLVNLAINQLEKVQPPGPAHLQELALSYDLLSECFIRKDRKDLAFQVLGRARAYYEATASSEVVAAVDAKLAELNAELNPESQPQPGPQEPAEPAQ